MEPQFRGLEVSEVLISSKAWACVSSDGGSSDAGSGRAELEFRAGAEADAVPAEDVEAREAVLTVGGLLVWIVRSAFGAEVDVALVAGESTEEQVHAMS
jgi:hypothetical protein